LDTPARLPEQQELADAQASPGPPPRPVDGAAIPVMLAPGQYQTVGGVVSEVNGNPIFASKVLRQLRGALSARATEMDLEQFRRFAGEEIRKRISGLQRDELIFGAADRFLEREDRQLAELLTMQYRTRRIADAGGSVELAQRRASAEGEDFEEQVYEQYRRFMTEMFFRRKVYPRIQITADDLRAYYNANVGREFTEQDEVTFRLIRIEPRVHGGMEAARQRAEALRAEAIGGDFAEVARLRNDDPRLARAGGLETPLQRGAYRLERVEQALWGLRPGEVSPSIEDGGALFIAKVEDRKTGHVRPFSERAVQDQIQRTLWSRQFNALRSDLEDNLRRNAMVRESPEMTQTVINMAMQGYAIWSRGS